MALDHLQVAIWRFERIAPLLELCLSGSERSRLVNEIASQPIAWPSGRVAPVDRSTLYAWLNRYQAKPCIESLLPKTDRAVHSVHERVIKREWVTFALGLLEEEPARSLYILSKRIETNFALAAAPACSTLYKALRTEPRYQAVRRIAKTGKRRTRFVAEQVHQIWQGDAKADFLVTFTDGTTHKLRILSLLDDCSRYILAAMVVESESLKATVKTFRAATERFGLPLNFYADRGSPYDSYLFRQALGILGIRRINTKPRNPSAHGKIEAYHRSLDRWFIKEFAHQPLRDMTHLQLLLDAMIDKLYHQHKHRELKQTPAAAFNNCISKRAVSLQRLHEAFLDRQWLRPERKTGNVRLGGTLFNVPSQYLILRRKLQFAGDLVDPSMAYLVDNGGKLVRLQPAVRIVKQAAKPLDDTLPVGSLSPLMETYRGRILPRPVSGFGLPEIYQILSSALHRDIPATENEGSLIIVWLRRNGPFQPEQFTSALTTACTRIGDGRPLTSILDELERIIKNSANKGDES